MIKHILLIDNSHGFGEIPLKNYLKSVKIPFKLILKASDLDRYPNEAVRMVILSGGPLLLTKKEHFDKFNMNIKALLKYDCLKLGICFGFQIMCMAYGGVLSRLNDQFCYLQTIRPTGDSDLFDQMLSPSDASKSEFEAQFCCNDVLEKMPLEFESIATAMMEGRERIVGVLYRPHNCIGFLFHPEMIEQTYPILEQIIQMTKT